MLEEDYLFTCPYCGEELRMRIDFTGGAKQEFVYDCEVCCRPIRILIKFSGGEVVDFSALRDDD